MEGKSQQKTRGKKNEMVKKKTLTLAVVNELGGTKEDLALLADIEDNSDSDQDVDSNDLDADPVRKDEVKDFIEQLEIYKYRPKHEDQQKETDKKKKKKDKDGEVDADGVSPETEKEEVKAPENPKKEKKEKNKYKSKKPVQHEEVTSTTRDPSTEYRSHMAAYKPRKYLLVKSGGDFLAEPSDTVDSEKLSDDMIAQMDHFAAKLLQDEIAVYNRQKETTKRSDVGWMKTVLTSGTLADKIAALTVLIQESPLHNLAHLDTLVSMAKKKGGNRANIQAIDSLRELFQSELLPSDRKLKPFSLRPLASLGTAVGWNKDALDKKILLWHFESKLKEIYGEFVKGLQMMSHDQLVASKQKAVKTIYHLLVDKPEQEKELMNLLINKVGDPHYKLASTVSYFLTKLVENHPNMKGVVVREVERLLFRPNVAPRAQYYSICFMNQLKMSHQQPELSSKLIHIYFAFFKSFVKKGEVDSKMMSALLSGVNRAYPYAKLEESFVQEQMDHLYKIVHLVNFNTSIQALMLLYQVMDSSASTSERYYVALYKKMSDPALKSSSKQALFLNLLFKSIKKDDSERRNKAFVKRLLQVCAYQQPQFTCGALVLLSEILRLKPGLMSFTHMEEESDEEEHFVDVDDPESETLDQTESVPVKEEGEDIKDIKPIVGKSSWVHRKLLNHKSDAVDYDPYHRNPQYCHAEKECIWELENLVEHFHPSVSLFAKQILKGEHIKYTGDPLQDFSLIRFLDRFVYKNPKKNNEDSVQNVSTLSHSKYIPQGVKSIPVNTDQFMKLGEQKIPVDDIFFLRYFQHKAEKEKKKAGREDMDSDAESVNDDEFDRFLDKYEGGVDGREIADLDFASELNKKTARKMMESSDEDEEDYDDLSDEDEIQFDEDDELSQAFREEMASLNNEDIDDEIDMDEDDEEEEGEKHGTVGFDEEDVDFSDDADEFGELAPSASKPKKRKALPEMSMGSRLKKGRKMTESIDLFAAADDFASVIDENAGSTLDSTGTEALANKDKADVKQLKWEMQRDRWIRGEQWGRKRGRGGGGRPRGGKPGSFRGGNSGGFKGGNSGSFRGGKPGGHKGHNSRGNKSGRGKPNRGRK